MPKSSEKSKIIAGLCENYMLNVIMATSSDEEEEEQTNDQFLLDVATLLRSRRSIHLGVPKSDTWEVNVLKKFDDSRFNQMVRVRPEEFTYIMDLIKDDAVFNTSQSTTQLPIDIQLKIVLYRLGSSGDGLSVRKVATLFDRTVNV